MNAKYIILFNPQAGNKSAKQEVYKLDDVLANNDLNYVEMTPDFDYKSFMNKVAADERVVLCGGDGTINRFINEVDESDLKKPVFYFPLGSGNDFNRDIHGKPDTILININNYIENLPFVTINGKSQKFINGIGYGIDGWCCEMGDKIRAKDSTKPINYTSIAIKGALFQYKKTNATVIVDGKEYHYKDVFLASTMKGRFYGGGMMAAPDQDRNDPEHKVNNARRSAVGGKLGFLIINNDIHHAIKVRSDIAIEILYDTHNLDRLQGSDGIQINWIGLPCRIIDLNRVQIITRIPAVDAQRLHFPFWIDQT